MDFLDDILAKLRHQYDELDASQETLEPLGSEPATSHVNSLDRLLNQLEPFSRQFSPLEKSEEKTAAQSTSLNQLLQELGANGQYSTPPSRHTEKQEVDSDLQQFVAQKNAEIQQKIAATAQAWLNQLDPLSGEGLWFMDFAKNHASPLAAAIELAEHSLIK